MFRWFHLGIKPNFLVLRINLLGWLICIANALVQTAVIPLKKKKKNHANLEWVIPAPISGGELRWAQMIRLQNSQVANSFGNYQTVGERRNCAFQLRSFNPGFAQIDII